jgi:hypothetical protein
MPRKPATKKFAFRGSPGPPPDQPDIFADRLAALSVDEKKFIREILTNPVFIKALRIADCQKPSSFHSGCLTDNVSPEHASLASVIKLSEIRGWELHLASMYLLMAPVIQRRQEVSEQFANEGRLDTEPATVTAKDVRTYQESLSQTQ